MEARYLLYPRRSSSKQHPTTACTADSNPPPRTPASLSTPASPRHSFLPFPWRYSPVDMTHRNGSPEGIVEFSPEGFLPRGPGPQGSVGGYDERTHVSLRLHLHNLLFTLSSGVAQLRVGGDELRPAKT
ncbi:hypothetical protein FIBSPDRAFT_529202 [Athelia psychrophila]|uniref:Uncharacterized protein n=1 Tax=Athelia psychrophila TaxID=1759441 RepID=A0A166JET7_9AGAM|nr:hypothetical protein FIBSPDRAFT_529202 [Fibularhizoctonia sp. CBS 109695]